MRSARAMSACRLLGALSVASGAMLLAAPRRMADLYGLPLRAGLARALGVRDVLIGIGLTQSETARGASVLRALADSIDVGLIAAEALAHRERAKAAGIRMSGGLVLVTYAVHLQRRLHGRVPPRSQAAAAGGAEP